MPFSVHVTAEHGYHKALVRVLDDGGRTFRGEVLLDLRWQSNEDAPDSWYGGHLFMDTENLPHFNEVVKVARAVLRIPGWRNDPLAVVNALRKRHKEVCYHPGMGEFYPVQEYPTGTAYMAVDERNYCIVKVLATDEDEARRRLLVELAEHASRKPHRYADDLKRWLERGQPVEVVPQVTLSTPDPRTAEEKLITASDDSDGAVATDGGDGNDDGVAVG